MILDFQLYYKKEGIYRLPKFLGNDQKSSVTCNYQQPCDGQKAISNMRVENIIDDFKVINNTEGQKVLSNTEGQKIVSNTEGQKVIGNTEGQKSSVKHCESG